MGIQLTTRLVPIPGIAKLVPLASPLGLLTPLVGSWQGHGFNTIFRPHHPSQESTNFLELNRTIESLDFTEISGEIPNRGFLQHDISMFGMTYLQQVSDANVKDSHGNPAGLHVEPGLWINIPATSDPAEPVTVARLGNIPHGTAVVAQGTATVVSGAPVIPSVDITPFTTGEPTSKVHFQSQNLSTPSDFRSPPADIVGVTQAMVDNPNSVLQAAVAGKTVSSTTTLHVSTLSTSTTTPNAGGGVADIAFLNGTAGGPNACVAEMESTFWICDYGDGVETGELLLYSQTVLLNFGPLSWPHLSVGVMTRVGGTGAEAGNAAGHAEPAPTA